MPKNWIAIQSYLNHDNFYPKFVRVFTFQYKEIPLKSGDYRAYGLDNRFGKRACAFFLMVNLVKC